jgi:OmpA-OmpF porin, OOP family
MTAPVQARRVAAAVLLGVVASLAAATGAVADETWLEEPTPPEEWPTASREQLDDSVTVFDLDEITAFTTDGSVSSVETVDKEGEETTISLATDVLFAPDEWELPEAATARIIDLVSQIPDGATVQVSGHTDSVVGAVDNQELSENRAEAVASVIAQARPDLDLEVAGFADTRPAVTENADDPSTFAANRRVEIVYSD